MSLHSTSIWASSSLKWRFRQVHCMPTSVLPGLYSSHTSLRRAQTSQDCPDTRTAESPQTPLYSPTESQKSQHEERHGMPTQPGQGQLPRVVGLEGTFSSQQSQACAAKDDDAAMRRSEERRV